MMQDFNGQFIVTENAISGQVCVRRFSIIAFHLLTLSVSPLTGISIEVCLGFAYSSSAKVSQIGQKQ